LKAIVIGGGIAGLTCARACLDAGIAVELFEKRPLESMLSGPGGIFIQRNAMAVYGLLCQGKIREQLYQQGAKILKGGFFSKMGDPLYINSPDFIKQKDLGVCLSRPKLQNILYNSLPENTVTNEAKLTDLEITPDQVRAVFDNGQVAVADLLIGADGLYSKVRAAVQGKESLDPPSYSGMTCWRGMFKPEKSLRSSLLYSWAEFWGSGNRFGYFEVDEDNFCFYAFNNTVAGGSDRAAGGAKQVLKSLFAEYTPAVANIIESLDESKIYRDDIFDRTPLNSQWGKGRVTLIGDAAHPVQPNLGQGGCMAIEDSFELVKSLSIAANSSLDIPSRLRQFEQSRTLRVEKVFSLSRQIGQLGQLDSPIGCFLRNSLYRLTPTWLGDLQFKWLFDYQPQINLE